MWGLSSGQSELSTCYRPFANASRPELVPSSPGFARTPQMVPFGLVILDHEGLLIEVMTAESTLTAPSNAAYTRKRDLLAPVASGSIREIWA